MGQIKTIGSFDKDGNNTPAKIDAAKTQTTGRELKIQNLMSHIGMAVDNLKNIHKSEGGWKGLYKKIVGSDTFQTGLATAVAYSVGAVAEGVSGSTLGALGAFALEAGDLISKHWGEPAGSFDVGEWVAIDNGAIRLKKAVQRTMAWGMGNWFHDFPQREDEEMETEKLVSFGFVIEPSTSQSDMVKVFNFETGENQDVRRNMVRALPGPRQMVLNTNENLAAIKAIVLDKDEVVHRLACDIPCDPGEEVIYKGKAYNIVTCDGTTARIGDSAWHFDVKMSELSRGRVAHTNSWNYKSFNKGLTSGFNSSSKSSFFKGQWVWIKPRAIILKVYPESLKELGVIRLINGTIGDGYYAVDGVRFQSHLTQVVPVHAERQEWLNRHKDFFKFRSFAVTGEASVTTYSLGRDLHRAGPVIGRAGFRDRRLGGE